MNNVQMVVDHQTLEQRANAVIAKLDALRISTESNFLDTCELLHEAHQGNYHVVFGFATFGDWAHAGLKISERQVFYLVGIWSKSLKLGLTRDDLREAGVSKLKKIFELDPAEHGEEMKQLVTDAAGDTLEQVTEKVNKLRAKDGQEPPVYMTLKLDPNVKDLVEQAFELARMNYGSVEHEGEAMEISKSKCMELLAISFINDPNNQNAG
jgi:hypothetical protein